MELGIYTFGDFDPAVCSAEERMQNLLEEIVLADQVGLDIFAIGEHHREEYLVSSPVVPLAAAAALTKNIRLSSAVTVLSSDDPIRVFQQFAELDLISKGRAEIMAGRGSFIESFSLFGYDLKDYDKLFSEKLEALLALQKGDTAGVYPKPVQNPLPIWLAVGGNPSSVVRAAALGLPLAYALIGGASEGVVPLIELYRSSVKKLGQDPETLPVSINSIGYIADTAEQAADQFYPHYAKGMNTIGKERGWSAINRHEFDLLSSLEGALMVGGPKEIAEKILFEFDLFRHQRFMLQLGIAGMPHAQTMHAIELFGKEVAPLVRKGLASRSKK